MKVRRTASPHFSSREGQRIRMVVLHADASPNAKGSIAWMQDPQSQVSYHYLIDRTGGVFSLVDEADKAWHAGKSTWAEVPVIRGSVNHVSIGVCVSNAGDGERYRPIQYETVGRLVADICRRHNIPAHLIRGHNEVSPGRKTDPYKTFDWSDFWGWFGFYSHRGPDDTAEPQLKAVA